MKKVFCQNCKQYYEAEDNIQAASYNCPQCNIPLSEIPLTPSLTPISIPASPAAKSRLAYCVLAILFGHLGIHNFYSGHYMRGVVKLLLSLLLCWTIIVPLGVSIWIIVEMLTVTADKRGVPFDDKVGNGIVILIIAIGLFCLLFIASILAAMLLPALSTSKEKARAISCVANVKQISIGYLMYTDDYEAAPTEMPLLTPYVCDSATFHCPSSADASQPSYYLVTYPIPIEKMSDPSTVPIIIERIGNHKKHITVAFADGHVETVFNDCNNYTGLLRLLPNIDSRELAALVKQLEQWDADRN